MESRKNHNFKVFFLLCGMFLAFSPSFAARGVKAAEQDGAKDLSPNAGRSEAIYAHCIGVQLGGENQYGKNLVSKAIVGKGKPAASKYLIKKILKGTERLEILWLLAVIGIDLA